ncbi:MAG: hypothetical protein ACOYO0_13980 [Sandarakinorhabdus sp.]
MVSDDPVWIVDAATQLAEIAFSQAAAAAGWALAARPLHHDLAHQDIGRR